MKNFTLRNDEIKLAESLTQMKSIDIIWDVNAFYFNVDKHTYKLECLNVAPEIHELFGEIFTCKFEKLKKYISFKNDKFKFWKREKYWYKLFQDCRILEIKFVHENKLSIEEKNYSENYTYLFLGFIIKTDKGFLPAFLLPENFGFHWQPKYDFYSLTELEILIAENKNCIEILNSW